MVKIIRKDFLAPKVVFVDGLWGCGKTMLSPILSSMDRVELLSYTYDLENICSLFFLNKISKNGAEAMIKFITDLKIYNTMMSRDVNFRPADLSSVFNDSNPKRYFDRLYEKGDEHIPEKILKEKPILNIATHNMLAFSDPIFSALKDRAFFIEVVRHPLYMIKQINLNMERLMNTPRNFNLFFEFNKKDVPAFSYGWEKLFLSSNSMDKAIYYIKKISEKTIEKKKRIKNKYKNQVLTICFEKFVTKPDEDLKKIEKMLDTKVINSTLDMLKKQNVPRSKYSEGIELDIYKRCGWEKPKNNLTELEELEIRRNYVSKFASSSALKILDGLCESYEKKHMKNYLNKM